MIRKEFPDYKLLKERADKAYLDETAPGTGTLSQSKFDWPLVILNTHNAQCHRPDIKGPFSLFTNISGTSHVSAGGKKVAVPDDCFFLTNRAQHYTLTIDSLQQPVETFNLHLGQDIWEEYVRAHIHQPSTLLDNPFSPALPAGFSEFPNLLLHKTRAMNQALHYLHRLGARPAVPSIELEESLAPLLRELFLQKEELGRRLGSLPASKASVRAELFKRIGLATDYLLAAPHQDPTLQELAQVACLSKFHFLRAFRQVHNCTPHQYLLQHRIYRSLPLLQKTKMPVGEVALLCGYPELSMFSRTFRKYMGCSPAHYRLHQN